MILPLSIWLATSIVGLMLAALGLLEGWRDMQSLREIPKNGRWMIARHQLLRYSLRAVSFVAFIAAVFASDYIVPLLILANLCLLANTASDLVTAAFLRADVRAKLEQLDQLEKGTGPSD
jgi:hypothetical protein